MRKIVWEFVVGLSKSIVQATPYRAKFGFINDEISRSAQSSYADTAEAHAVSVEQDTTAVSSC